VDDPDRAPQGVPGAQAGLLLALVLTSALPAWAGVVSARPDQPASACVDAAADPHDATEQGRC
jgi:hypothetical protein